MIIAPLFYAGPISYYRAILNGQIIFDLGENFVKQTYRNRCSILGANGPLNLIVPIVHNGKQHMKDVRISNQEKWQSIHWKSIVSSYRNSPYFEFYELDIRPLYLRQYDYLVDFNFDILHSIQSILDIEIIHEKSFEYIDATRNNQDLRSCFNAKNRKREVKPYVQVFAGKMDFEQDLSILDLIFNTGPEASIYLKQM